MEYDHTHNKDINLGTAFKTGIAINIAFIAVESYFGFSSNSMALLADAGHNFSDVLVLAFSWIGVLLSQRQATLRFTYGFRQSTILIALLNTILLLAAVVFIVWETIERLNKPALINAKSVIIVAAIGSVVNGITAWLFLKGKKHDLNIRSAFVHFIADALVSLGVVASGFVIAFTGMIRVDSLVSFTIVAVILYGSYHLLIDSVSLALDAVPKNVDIEKVREYLTDLPEVSNIHDLHIWALSTTDTALTVHITARTQTDTSFIFDVQRQLQEQFGIGHTTIQVEHTNDTTDCNNCN